MKVATADPVVLRIRNDSRDLDSSEATQQGTKGQLEAKGDADEKVLRRRLQYKLHQRRHRAKQKEKTLALEKEVAELSEDVARLQDKCTVLKSRNMFGSRGLGAGAPAKVVMEYFRQYEHGYSHARCNTQEEFLRSVMLNNVNGPDYHGLTTVLSQWQLYGSYFLSTKYTTQTVEVSTIADLTIVVVNAVIDIRPRREGLLKLCPSLLGNEEAIQEVLGNPISIPGKYRFTFEEDGLISWFGADLDFVNGLKSTFGSLEKVALFMQDAQISFSTGQIQSESADAITNPRLNVDFLLS
ncbi:hypothetical protein Poli38472_009164 [Pythium oligandrum]|uniref:BZIP domain-containing protein n=1 Tax=Pythium oligandrum TaxID=41045 RepID=A0A8K1FML6_PYTOL|nr:hypothetical protein Poli38472_009164 [Pythium oligandrum]|eukprot:TMW64997.1 hypothetical protein Poli38472_009164 [Pythium oligandrum]